MKSQFTLLRKRRFLPLFITQFLGAFNDNVYKNAVIIIIAFSATSTASHSNTLINIAGALFILPFFLFSATFGQIADATEKARLVRFSKILEIIITIIATLAFFLHSIILLLTALFLLGTQATLFGPVKYSILPQHLKMDELVGGNGLIESATFIAILTGTIFGGILITIPDHGKLIVSVAIITIAILGYISSRFIPKAPSLSDRMNINWNLFTSTWQNIKYAKRNKEVFLAILGISWFWFYGAFMFYQTPNYTKIYLGGNAHVATLIIALFSVGIGVGSLLCEKMSHHIIEIGLVPIAAIILSVLTADLYHLQPVAAHLKDLNVFQFLHYSHHVGVVVDILFIGFASGLFTVPLYSLIQARSSKQRRSRIIAANNVFNAILMVLAAVFAITLLHYGLTIPQIFLILAALNAIVTIFIFSISGEFIIRFIVFVFVAVAYRLKRHGTENLNIEGPAILTCNHVSFVDVLMICSSSNRPIRFIMDYQLYKAPILGAISRLGHCIPIATEKEDPAMKARAFEEASNALRNGSLICIFPEGNITRDGEIAQFKRGIEILLDRQPVPVIPMALYGMWGSFFSRKYGKAMSHFPKRFWSRISLHIGKAIPAKAFTLDGLQNEIEHLYALGEKEIEG